MKVLGWLFHWVEQNQDLYVLNLAFHRNNQISKKTEDYWGDGDDRNLSIIVLDEKGFQSYFLEFDVTLTAGSFAIRTEAFLETLDDEEDLF